MNLSVRSGACCTWALTTLLLHGIASGQHGGGAPPPTNRRNVLVILLDDLGIEALSTYSDHNDQLFDPYHFCLTDGVPKAYPDTQHLNQLAMEGVRFMRAYSYPVCSSTRAALLTGRHAFRTGIGDAIVGNYPANLATTERSIPKMLKSGFPTSWPKYKCGAFGKWHLTSQGGDNHPIQLGFDAYTGFHARRDHYDWDLIEIRTNPSWTLGPTPESELPAQYGTFDATVIRKKAVEW